MGCLVLERKVRRGRGANNCLVFDVPGVGRVKVWLTPRPNLSLGGVKVAIDAPPAVKVLRGELAGIDECDDDDSRSNDRDQPKAGGDPWTWNAND